QVQTYTVRAGDNLAAIARDHGVTTAALAAANGIAMADPVIRVGQTLTIPTAPASTQTAAVQLPAGQSQTQAQPDVPPAGGTQQASVPPPATAQTQTQTQTGIGLRWPATGRVVAEFGTTWNNEPLTGIKISVPQ